MAALKKNCCYFSNLILLLLLDKSWAACTNNGKPEDQKSISALQGKTWTAGNYIFGVCPNDISKHVGVGALLKTKEVVLGRTNCTHISSGDGWVLLVYHGGDNSTNNKTCNSVYSAEILFFCDAQNSPEGEARFIGEDECVTRFEVRSSLPCVPEGASMFTLFLVCLLFVFSLYCLCGIAYRRFHLKLQGRQQLPHFPFWRRIGHSCAECCNWACRCEEENIETWNSDVDRDDVLLRP